MSRRRLRLKRIMDIRRRNEAVSIGHLCFSGQSLINMTRPIKTDSDHTVANGDVRKTWKSLVQSLVAARVEISL